MRYYTVLILAVLSLTIVACSDSGSTFSNSPRPKEEVEWLIPDDEVFAAGPGKDGIPSIDHPNYVTASDDQGKLDWLDDNDLILGIKIGEEIRGYPHPLLDWHEIINDDFGPTSVAITYCPLTGTGIGWNRTINGEKTTFGVSGLLYNSNLMPYDRVTDSYWSQMRLDCVSGEMIGLKARTYQLVELPWRLWRQWFPNAKVVAEGINGFARPYDIYPYGNYKTQPDTYYPVNRADDNRRPDKERVLGLSINGKVLVYTFASFQRKEIDIQSNFFQGEKIIVFGSENKNFMAAYYSKLEDGTPVSSFEPIQNKNAVLARDSLGNEWNIFGEAVSGPFKGMRLRRTGAIMGYWFTWPSFYEDIELF